MTRVSIVATIVVFVLVLLAGLHFYWGVGGRWPGHDDRSLVEYVVGRTRDMRAPTFWACMFVTAALLTSAVLVALYAGLLVLPLPEWLHWLARVGYWGAFAVFAARGIAGYIPSVFRYAEGTPFARLNRLYYSPLCLAVAAGFIVIHLTAKLAQPS